VSGLRDAAAAPLRPTLCPAPAEVEARLVALARGPGALRRALARVAGRVVATRAWGRLGYARLEDYATERAGVSGRELCDLAKVDGALAELPGLERAFLAGEIGWTKLRLLCRVARPEDEAWWLAQARALRVRELEREVREVDRRARSAGEVGVRAAVERGNGPEDDAPRVGGVLTCTPRARALWWRGRQTASRVAGRALSQGAFAEVLTAEVLSAVPLEGEGPPAAAPASAAPGPVRVPDAAPSGPVRVPPPPETLAARACAPSTPPPTPPRFVTALERGLENAGADELDARLRRALRLEAQGLARIAAGLAEVAARRLHRSLGFQSLDAWVEERLGLARSRARALLRVARAGERAPALRAAFAEGRLSWVRAHALLPLVLEADPALDTDGWVAHAVRVGVRRLRDDVEAALATGDLALPPLAPSTSAGPAGVQTGARAGLPKQTARLFFSAPADVAHLFRAALATVQRRIERVRGRPACQGEALEAMLEHALETWDAHGRAGRRPEQRLPREYRVFERDGWRCTVPGCSSFRNLHAHHVVFRSRGGTDDLANLTTLCAWHHLRGVHAGRVRVTGTAPHGLRFELGLRAGAPPLVTNGPGEVLA